MNMKKVALALGSGGTRGFAHLGILEVLEEEGIQIGGIAGSSIGAVVGGMYAFRPKIAPNLTHMKKYLSSDLYDATRLHFLEQNEMGRKSFYEQLKIKFSKGAVFAASLAKPSLFSQETLRKNVSYLIPPVNIEEALIPLCINSFDIITGQEKLFTKGNLTDAVMASCAIPGVFPPVKIDDELMMDGGIVNPVPCNHAEKFGADIIIAVDLNPHPGPMPNIDNSYDIAMRAADISRLHLKEYLLKSADIVISVEVTDIFWADFSKFDDCLERGKAAAKKALPQIISLLNKKEENRKTNLRTIS
jgi:NTE family protein